MLQTELRNDGARPALFPVRFLIVLFLLLIVLFYVLFVNVYCTTATGCQPNCN